MSAPKSLPSTSIKQDALGELGYFPRREGVLQCTSRSREMRGILFHKKGSIPTCQKAKNRRTSCMRHQRHRAPHFTLAGGALWAVATQYGGFPWTAGRQRAAAKGFPAKGRFPVLSRSLLPVSRTAPRHATAVIRRRRLVSPVSVAHFTDPQVPALAGATNPRPSTRLAAMGYYQSNKVSPEKRNAPGPESRSDLVEGGVPPCKPYSLHSRALPCRFQEKS